MHSDTVKATIGLILALTETVREAGETGAPSGVLFAAFNAKGISLRTYERLEAVAIGSGMIEKRGLILYWVGPQEVAA
jgi:hypothetical protein